MYEAERHEVETLRDSLLGDLLTEPDPMRRYHALTREQALLDALVSEVKRLRGAALAEARDGLSLEAVAVAAGLGTYQRAQKLITASRQERALIAAAGAGPAGPGPAGR
jgi:hypothetical protein